MPTLTTKYSLYKPLPFDLTDSDVWGGYLNDNFDKIDTLLGRAINWTVTSKGGDYTVSVNDYDTFFPVNANTASFTMTLPTAVGNTGLTFSFKKVDNTANTITIDPAGAEQIDGAVSYILTDYLECITIVSDGVGWQIVSRLLYVAPNTDTRVLQTVVSQVGTVGTGGATPIPADNTVPLITEGDEYMNVTITPKSATSRLVIESVCILSCGTQGNLVSALFRDAGTNALKCSYGINAPAFILPLPLQHEVVSGSTAATTFRIRGGHNTGSTVTFNGQSGSGLYGGTSTSFIRVTEYL